MPAARSFTSLFKPLEASSSLCFSNRLVLSSPTTGLESLSSATPLLEFYKRRAGVGAVITGGLAVHTSGKASSSTAVLSKKKLAQFTQLTQGFHQWSEGNSLIIAQLTHAGIYSQSKLAIGPSATFPLDSTSTYLPLPLSPRVMPEVVAMFAEAAVLAVEAGFDGVELDVSYGSLLHQFFSPRFNLRSDLWSGVELLQEVVRGIRVALGVNIGIAARLPMSEGSLPQLTSLGKILQEVGVDLLHCTEADPESSNMLSWLPHFKSKVGLPVLLEYPFRFRALRLAEEWVQSGCADLIGLSRSLVADPEFVRKATSSLESTSSSSSSSSSSSMIVPCTGCGLCDSKSAGNNINEWERIHALAHPKRSLLSMLQPQPQEQQQQQEPEQDQVAPGIPPEPYPHILCEVNPSCGRETTFSAAAAVATVSRSPSRVIGVIGAGVTGLAVALTAANRGHRVVVYEARDYVGGAYSAFAQVPSKSDTYLPLLDYYKKAMLSHPEKITVKLSVALSASDRTSAELLAQDHVQVVVNCSGSYPHQRSSSSSSGSSSNGVDFSSSSSSSSCSCSSSLAKVLAHMLGISVPLPPRPPPPPQHKNETYNSHRQKTNKKTLALVGVTPETLDWLEILAKKVVIPTNATPTTEVENVDVDVDVVVFEQRSEEEALASLKAHVGIGFYDLWEFLDSLEKQSSHEEEEEEEEEEKDVSSSSSRIRIQWCYHCCVVDISSSSSAKTTLHYTYDEVPASACSLPTASSATLQVDGVIFCGGGGGSSSSSSSKEMPTSSSTTTSSTTSSGLRWGGLPYFEAGSARWKSHSQRNKQRRRLSLRQAVEEGTYLATYL